MILKIDVNNPDIKILKQAVSIIKNGGTVVYPTETAYGLGCDALNKKAIDKVLSIKKRPENLPLPIIVSSLKMIKKVAIIDHTIEKLSQIFHPGPLVIALPKKPIISDLLNKNGIALRISSNLVASKLVTLLNRPLVSTSANLSGQPTPYCVEDVNKSLNKDQIDIILDGGLIPLKKPSTIIDFTLKPAPQITRVGEISPQKIFEILEIPENEWKNHLKEK